MPLDDKWLTDMFVGMARDVTPPAAAGDATVLYAPFSSDSEILRRCASVLSPNESLFAERFISPAGKKEFLFRRAFRRYCASMATSPARPLSEFDFSETGNGRPFLAEFPDIWFSFSSCSSGCFAAWSTSHAVGVDIEISQQEIEAEELARQYFSASEARVVAEQGVSTFLRFWSLKEAALKSIGKGLPFGLDAFTFEIAPIVRILQAPADKARFRAHEIALPNSAAALVTRDITSAL